MINRGARKYVGYYLFETGSYENLLELKNEEYFVPAWLPDSRRLVYEANNKIFFIDVETKKIREIYSNPDLQVRAPFVSRDERLIYYTVHTFANDIWMLDNTQNQ
ncbi:MAG: hypothetical protein M3209_12785 [Acidobacteriota bacterium]|nr:hypothetical protein [Acidobacteriota bacterium]